ncbi:beta strand repeat-containing protein, partial [Methylobacterium tarhaniae]|uniref:beta strand repeat-containing protein n=1 Tax=Methylobacterium tarhaniae TaxID=1187852 RepID=UPI003D049AB3
MTIKFDAQQTFGAGSSTYSVVSADVNGDGKLDLITANQGDSSLSVLLGNGDGTFQSQQTFATGRMPFSVTAADLNQDGKLDLVATSFLDSSLSVLLGNGNGTFGAQQTFTSGNNATSVTAADLNGDGKLDLVSQNSSSGTMSVLLGNGNGTFKDLQSYSTGAGSQPASVTTADVNRDGKADLVVASYGSSNLSVLLGNGDGTFQAQQTFGTGTASGPRSVVVADVNRDGKLDLVSANIDSNAVSVLLGNGDGTFQAQQSYSIGAGSQPSSVAVADVDGDGTLDLVVTNLGKSSVSVLSGNGNGTFQTPQTLGTGSKPIFAAVADLNGDGKRDVVTANQGAGNVSVLLGAGGVRITAVTASVTSGTKVKADTPLILTVTTDTPTVTVDTAGGTPFLTLNNGKQATYIGTDGPGKLQFTYTVAAGDDTTGLKVTGLTLNGGKIGAPGTIVLSQGTPPSTDSTPVAVTSADVDGDGKLDLITANNGNKTLSLLLGNGDGTFKAQQTLTAGFIAQQKPVSVTTADYNKDGKLDIVYSMNGYTAAGVLIGNGDGTFKSPSTMSTGGGNAGDPRSVTVADVNRDGNLDIITANAGADLVSVHLGRGNSYIAYPGTLSTGAGSKPTAVAVADVNGDGTLDLVTANKGTGTVSVLLGNGDGSFQAHQDIATGSSTSDPSAVAIVDVDRDGKLDLVVALSGASTVTVLKGNGNGTFAQTLPDVTTGSMPVSVATADINGDGKLDLVTANKTDNTMSLLLGNGDGTFASLGFNIQVGSGPSSVTTADVDGDGRPDILIANSTGNTATVVLNQSIPAKELATASLATATGADTGIVIDTTAPTVTGVTSSAANRAYKAGDTISVRVGFSEAVTVTGTPQLTLATGGAGRAVDYTSGSGTNSLTFT